MLESSKLDRLGLGTVQFGLDYGVSNNIGQTTQDEVYKILQYAFENNITTIDTANTYGNSEDVLGHSTLNKNFNIISKTIPILKSKIKTSDIKLVTNGIFESLRKLRINRLDGLLVHHCQDLIVDGGNSLYRRLSELKNENIFLKLGVSAYSGEEIDFVLNNYDIDIIQIPMNVFDQRLLKSGTLKKLKEAGVEVHVRSAFLQGLALMSPQELPDKLFKFSLHLEKFHSLTKEMKISPLAACLAFLMQQTEINKVIFGVNSLKQLQQLIQTVLNLPWVDLKVFDAISINDINLLNPSKW